MGTETEAEELRAEVARLTARVAELEAGGVTASHALAESRQRLDYALGVAGIVAWDWDPVSGHVLHSYDVNQNLSGKIANRSEYARLIHPDDAAATAAAFEQAFRSGTEYRAEYRIVTEAGVRWILSAGRPFDTPGGRRRTSGVMFDVTARHDADAELRAAAERLRLAVDSAQLGDWSLDQRVDVILLSERAASFYGVPPGPIGRYDLHALIHPEDIGPTRETINQALVTGEPYLVEYRVPRDGRTVWLMTAGRATYDTHGNQIGQVGVMQDITERREAGERQQLLMRELNHRVKNTLAIVQALALQSRRGSNSPESFAETFDGRLRALSAAHSLLTSTGWQGADIAGVVRGALNAFDASGQRVPFSGPAVTLGASVSLNLALALHELATNAMKYGALSAEVGRVALDWRLDENDLVIRWLESGGPSVAEPARRGFGARLIEHGVTREVGGTASLEFRPEGLACELRLPLSQKVRPL